MKKKILFICTGNLDRSPTAEEIYNKKPELEVKSAGIASSANRILTGDLIEWADLIFVMEEVHKKYIINWMPEVKKKLYVLNIENKFLKNDPDLINLIKERVDPILND